MVKEKKVIEKNLFGRSFLFALLSIAAIVFLPYMVYFGSIFFTAFFQSLSQESISVSLINLILALTSSILVFLAVKSAFRNGSKLWTEWQRQQAIFEEDERVQRLIETESSLKLESDAEESQQQKHQNL